MRIPYTYTTLRYVHDVAAGESLNVGVVVHAPGAGFIGARLQTNFGRLRKTFPVLDGESHRRIMRYLQARFDTLQMRSTTELPLNGPPRDVMTIASEVLPHDDSSLRWSEIRGGLTADPAKELEHLYARLVALNDPSKADKGRDDEIVWSQFRAPLVREKVINYLSPHKVVAQNDEVEFEHAWKNDQWHCLLPLSLDLVDAENIKAKSHRLLGQMIGVSQQTDHHRLYLMVGEPQIDKNKPAAARALNLLRQNLPLSNEIIHENEAESFSRDFAGKIRAHLAQLQDVRP